MVVSSELRTHKVMEATIRELMGAGTPPRFKFKNTYASIEFPAGYTVPAQATLEAKYNELLALEEDIQKTAIEGDMEVGTSNLFVDTETGRVGIGRTDPQVELDVSGVVNVSSNLEVGTSKLFVDTETGRVGIGTTSPVGKLHFYQSGGGTNMIDKRTNISTADFRQTLNYTHYSSVAQGANRDPDNSRGLWIGNMVDENDGPPSGANFAAFTDSFQFYAVADLTKYDDGLSFISNTDTLKYNGGDFVKVMHINANGNVGIGVNNPGYTLDVDGTIYSSGDVIMFSDERKKTDIEPIPNALEKVLQLRGVTFNKLDDDNRRHAGVIAQEVEKVLPEVVYTAEDGTKSVAYGNMIGLLIEAIKELVGSPT